MAGDIAQLGLKIDSSQVDRGASSLDKFRGSAHAAEVAVNQFGGKAGAVMKGLVAANDNAASSAMRVGSALGSVVGALVAMVAAGAGAALGLAAFVTNSIDADNIQAQLAAALRSTGNAAGQSVDSLNEHAAALQKITSYEDDTIGKSQALLLTFTKIQGTTFDEATGAILDMATAMGGDLQGATIQVGKALNSPIEGVTALGRAGVQFTASQKAMIKSLVETGSVAEAQKIVLKELETQFGGSAVAARATLGGALKSLGNAWGNLFEISTTASTPLRTAIEALITAVNNPAFQAFVTTIGVALFGALTAVVQGATSLVNALVFVVERIDYVAVAAGATGAVMLVAFGPAILSAVASLTAAIAGGLVGAVYALTAAIAANPIGALAVAFVAAVVAVYHFRDAIKESIGVDVVDVAKTSANFLINSFTVAFENMKFLWNTFPAIIGTAVYGAINAMIAGINTMIQAAATSIDWLIAKVNKVPGVNLSKIGATAPLAQVANPYADRLSAGLADRNSAVTAAMGTDNFAGSAAEETNKKTEAVKRLGGATDGLAESEKKEKSSYEQTIDATNRKIAVMQAELAGIGLTEEAAARLKYEQQLLNDANKDGIALSPTQVANLQALAGQMSALEAKTKAAKEQLDFAKDASKGFLSDLTSGLRNGEGFWESFGKAANNVLDKIINKIESNLVDALFSATSTSSGTGGLFGGLLNLFGFADGGYTGSGPAGAVAGVVHGGEYVFDKATVDAMGVSNLEALRKGVRGYRSGGYVGTTPAGSSSGQSSPITVQIGETYIDARGADSATATRLAAVEKRMAEEKASLARTIVATVARKNTRGTV